MPCLSKCAQPVKRQKGEGMVITVCASVPSRRKPWITRRTSRPDLPPKLDSARRCPRAWADPPLPISAPPPISAEPELSTCEPADPSALADSWPLVSAEPWTSASADLWPRALVAGDWWPPAPALTCVSTEDDSSADQV